MKCKQCQTKVEKGAKFCGTCGQAIKHHSFILYIAVILGCVILFVLGIFTVSQRFQSEPGAQDLINEFFKVVRENDTQAIKELFLVDDEEVEDLDEFITYLQDYYNENRSALVADLQDLKDDYPQGKYVMLPYYIVKEDQSYFMKINYRKLWISRTESTDVSLYQGEKEVEEREKVLPLSYTIYVSTDWTDEVTYDVDLFYSYPDKVMEFVGGELRDEY